MSGSFLFTFFLVISHWTTCGHALRTAIKTIAVNDLRRHCNFGLKDLNYDLCPLMGRTVTVEDIEYVNNNREGSSSGRRFYDITLGGLTSERTARSLSDLESCDRDTWVCLRELSSPVPEDTNPNKVQRNHVRSIPLAMKLKVFSLDAVESSGQIILSLRLDLDGGRWNGTSQSVRIEFSCSLDDKLVFASEVAGEHLFVWATRHACHQLQPQNTGFRKMISVMEDGAEKPVPEEGGEKCDDDFLPGHRMRKTRRWIAIILVVFVTTLFCGYMAYSSRARHFTREKLKGVSYALLPLLSQAYVKLRPIVQSINIFRSKWIMQLGTGFRQGAGQLVNWAQEDMALDDAEDIMVNGASAYDLYDAEGEDWNRADEYIPLTINPRYGRSRRIRSYGTTPDVETFEERGLMSGIGKYFRK